MYCAHALAPSSKDVLPGMEVELIGSPEIFGTVIKVEGKRVRVDLSASGGKSSVWQMADELGPRGDGQVGRKQALFCGRDDGLLDPGVVDLVGAVGEELHPVYGKRYGVHDLRRVLVRPLAGMLVPTDMI